MKLTLWHASLSGELRLEKRDPLSHWTVIIPDGRTITARGSLSAAVAKAEAFIAAGRLPDHPQKSGIGLPAQEPAT